MSRAGAGLRNRVASGKIPIPLLGVGLVVLSFPSLCAGQDAGQVKFVNSCPYSLTFNSSGPSRVDNVPELFFHDEGHAGEGRKVLRGKLSGCVSTSDR